MPPRVSILIPYYNRVDQMRRSLYLLSEQTYRDFEVLIIDDGSEMQYAYGAEVDGFEPYQCEYHTIRPAGAPSRSPNIAWWFGYQRASGDFVILSHPEIMVPKNAIELMLHNHGKVRSVPTLYTIPGQKQQNRIDRVRWREKLEYLQLLPDFWTEMGRWGYTNRDAPTYTHHFGFTGQYRYQWDRWGFLPRTEEPRSDDSWMQPREVEAGLPPKHLPMIECYHQWHPPLPHQAAWRDHPVSARIQNLRNADREAAKKWSPSLEEAAV